MLIYFEVFLFFVFTIELISEFDAFQVSGYECLQMMINPNLLRKAQRVKQNPEVNFVMCEQNPEADVTGFVLS